MQLPATNHQSQERRTLNVSVVAVDQVYHAVYAKINSYPFSLEGGFSEGQQVQSVGKNCTNITYIQCVLHTTQKQ